MAGNVLGGELESCGTDPMTGFYRDGCCDTGTEDAGVHTVCAVVTEEFLRFSAQVGNDLVTARPEFGFRGLRPGDRWCLCASRWAQAHEAGVAPPVVLAATHARSLEWIDLADLQRAEPGGMLRCCCRVGAQRRTDIVQGFAGPGWARLGCRRIRWVRVGYLPSAVTADRHRAR